MAPKLKTPSELHAAPTAPVSEAENELDQQSQFALDKAQYTAHRSALLRNLATASDAARFSAQPEVEMSFQKAEKLSEAGKLKLAINELSQAQQLLDDSVAKTSSEQQDHAITAVPVPVSTTGLLSVLFSRDARTEVGSKKQTSLQI